MHVATGQQYPPCIVVKDPGLLIEILPGSIRIDPLRGSGPLSIALFSETMITGSHRQPVMHVGVLERETAQRMPSSVFHRGKQLFGLAVLGILLLGKSHHEGQ